jgi:hypothetical protein
MRSKAVLVRCSALACCSSSRLLAIGVRLPDFRASAIFYSPYMKYFYVAWVSGWLLGLGTLQGRARVLVIAGIASCTALLAQILFYVFLENAPWSFPLPVYAEQSLFPLFLVSAVAGYWGALRTAAPWARALIAKVMRSDSVLPRRRLIPAKGVAAFVVVVLVPAALVNYAINRPVWMTDLYNERWPNLRSFLLTIPRSLLVGRFRGATYSLFLITPFASRWTIYGSSIFRRSTNTISS